MRAKRANACKKTLLMRAKRSAKRRTPAFKGTNACKLDRHDGQ